MLFVLKDLKRSLLGYFQGWEAADALTRWVFGGPAWPNLCCLQHVNTVIVWKRFYVAYNMRTQVVLMFTTCEYIVLNHVNITNLKNTKITLYACFCTPLATSLNFDRPKCERTLKTKLISWLLAEKLLFFLMQPKDQLRYQFVYIVYR